MPQWLYGVLFGWMNEKGRTPPTLCLPRARACIIVRVGVKLSASVVFALAPSFRSGRQRPPHTSHSTAYSVSFYIFSAYMDHIPRVFGGRNR